MRVISIQSIPAKPRFLWYTGGGVEMTKSYIGHMGGGDPWGGGAHSYACTQGRAPHTPYPPTLPHPPNTPI